MIPIRFAEANVVVHRPEGGGFDNVASVHAFRGNGLVITAWRPSPEELVKINLGEPIWLSLMAEAIPPVALSADYPFRMDEADL